MNTSPNLVLPGAGRLLRLASAGIVAFALVATSLAWFAREQQVQSIANDAQLRARGAAADVDRYVQSQLLTLVAIAAAPEVAERDLEGMQAYLDRLDPDGMGFTAGLAWIDETGWQRARSGYDGPDLDYSDREHIQQVLRADVPVVSSAFVGLVNPVPLISFGVPTHASADGRLTGAIVAGLRLDNVRFGADSLRYAGGTQVHIVDRKGQIVARDTPVTALIQADPAFALDEMRAAGSGAWVGVPNPEGQEDRLIGFAVAPGPGWLVLVDQSASAAFAPANSVFMLQAAAIGLAALTVAVILLWAARRVDRAARIQADALAAERRARDELQAAVAELQERQAMRDAFVGVMSHELRTPVTTIYGAAKLLAKSPHRADLESLILDIEEESDRLHRITEDLLVLSRAERGGMVIHTEPVLLQRLVPSIRNDLQRRFPAIAFDFRVPEGLPPLAADPGPMRQILNNLLTNAAKYGAGAPVRLTARAVGSEVRLEVEDEGPGFPDGEAEQLFELFYRSASNARSAAGTGIGLYVVRQLATAMGGTVTAEPGTPHGARFVVTLPSYAADTVEPAAPAVSDVATEATAPATARGALAGALVQEQVRPGLQ